MDNQNTYKHWYIKLVLLVLILVLMDNQNTSARCQHRNKQFCLNPCSNG